MRLKLIELQQQLQRRDEYISRLEAINKIDNTENIKMNINLNTDLLKNPTAIYCIGSVLICTSITIWTGIAGGILAAGIAAVFLAICRSDFAE